MIRTPIALLALLAIALPAAANDAKDLAPTGTLRAVYIATNPVQAFVDPTTKEDARSRRRPRARAWQARGRAGHRHGARGVEGVIDSVRTGLADIGFVAFGPMRATQVDFSQTYSLAQNSYVVPEASSIKSVADVDRAGVRIGVGERDAGDLFLTRTLKNAELRRNEGGIGDATMKLLLAGELEAYAGNRMRLHEAVQKTPGLRLLPDNFYGVEQAVIVPKGETARLAIVNRVIDEARASGFIADVDRARRTRRRRRRAGRFAQPEMKAGPCRSAIPQSCFLQRAGATIARHRMRMHCAMRGCVEQVTNV